MLDTRSPCAIQHCITRLWDYQTRVAWHEQGIACTLVAAHATLSTIVWRMVTGGDRLILSEALSMRYVRAPLV